MFVNTLKCSWSLANLILWALKHLSDCCGTKFEWLEPHISRVTGIGELSVLPKDITCQSLVLNPQSANLWASTPPIQPLVGLHAFENAKHDAQEMSDFAFKILVPWEEIHLKNIHFGSCYLQDHNSIHKCCLKAFIFKPFFRSHNFPTLLFGVILSSSLLDYKLSLWKCSPTRYTHNLTPSA